MMDKPALYHLCSLRKVPYNLRRFSHKVSGFLGIPRIESLAQGREEAPNFLEGEKTSKLKFERKRCYGLAARSVAR